MKTKCTLFLTALLISGGLFAQTGNCNTQYSIFGSYAKVKQYKQAEPIYKKLVKNCPSVGLALYQYGARMYKHFLEEGEPTKKMEYAQALIKNYENRLQQYPTKTKKGATLARIAQVMYDNEMGTKAEIYAKFDEAWNTDKESFQSPKSLYTYFSLLVDLHDQGKKSLQEVFKKYEEVINKIEQLEIEKAEMAAPLIKKQEAGKELTSKEQRILSNSEIYLKNYSLIKGSIKTKLGQRADCENLIPLFKEQFDAKKGNTEWLKIAASRMSAKDCTDSPLFGKLVEALHKKEPSAKSAFYLGKLAEEAGNSAKAMDYYTQAAELEDNPADKAAVYYVIANSYKNKGRYSTARRFYRKALEQKPSLGAAYLQIASMYASSANNCGNSTFNKRAVYWLAADYARRAGRVNPSLEGTAAQAAASYNAKAPQRSNIFQSGKAGQTISIGCWIGESVRVPTL